MSDDTDQEIQRLVSAGNQPLVVIFSGPSGVGKDSVIERMLELDYPISIPATMITRPARHGEVDGVHHLFVSVKEFERQVATGELLEHAIVYGNRYGVPRSQVRSAIATGKHVMIRVDVQGAASLRKTLPGAPSVFLMPDDIANLEAHLRSRGSEDEDEVQRRLFEVKEELTEAEYFDYVVENIEGDLDATVRAVASVICAEMERPDRVAIEI